MDTYLVERIDASADCWLWTGPRTANGYGRCKARSHLREQLAHRAVYQALVGDPGESLDHLCLNKLCVNPDHLERVTIAVNTARKWPAKKVRCKRGHLNWYIGPNGWRKCRTCHRDRQRKGGV
jgi:hypothetical protein